jgi:hypothetical protein
MAISYPPARTAVQTDQASVPLQIKTLAQAIDRLSKGISNTSMFVTLDAGAATTTVIDPRFSGQTCAAFMPQTANAAAEIPTLWAECSNGQMVVHHTNSAVVDRVFTVGVSG